VQKHASLVLTKTNAYVFTQISAHLPSNQTHERKTNVFEGDIFEVARVNNNNVRRNTIAEKSELNDKFSGFQIMESRSKYESNPMSRY
jgi:hypothetical protein